MSRVENEIRVTLSVLDRLLDDEPEVSREGIPSRSKSLRQLKDSVRRDLEWLLNTRHIPAEVPSDLKEVNNSVAVYGLPDFSSLSVQSPEDQKQMIKSIRDTIRVFEPRLDDVTVALEQSRTTERALRFRIDARLKVEPAPEPVRFDTILQMGTGQYVVKSD
jgi:type VI secretion system protein ImpF